MFCKLIFCEYVEIYALYLYYIIATPSFPIVPIISTLQQYKSVSVFASFFQIFLENTKLNYILRDQNALPGMLTIIKLSENEQWKILE